MTDIVERLRRHAMITEEVGCGSDQGRRIAPVTMREAATEIERLRKALEPFALNVGAVSLSKALGHISREHLWAARDALSSTNSNPTGNIEGGAA